MTDTTTEAVEGLARRIEQHAEPMDSIKIKDVLDMSAHCGVAMLRALAAERDTLHAQLATAQAQAQTAREDALREAANLCATDIGETFERGIYMDWRVSDQHVLSRRILALVKPTPTTPRTDAATEE